jgi:hypothetical protein
VHKAGRSEVKILVNIMKANTGIKGKVPLTLNQDPKCRQVVYITSELLSPAKGPHYPLNSWLVEHEIWSGCLRDAKYLLPLPPLKPRSVYLIT